MSVDQIKERLNNLHQLLVEEINGDGCREYIDDLGDSINAAERELSFHQKNPDGVQMVGK